MTGNGALRGKVVVVTGASGGVGRATARLLGECGASVAVLARGERGLHAAARDVTEAGGRGLPVTVDVADHDALADAADHIEWTLGPIDIWVNVAFATLFAPFTEITPAEYERATRVTYLGYVWGTRVALERMRPRNRGVIVQTGSAMAYRGIPLQSVYSGAKHAIQGFTEALRSELLHERSGIAVTMVQLPAVNTPQFDWAASRLPRHPQPVPPIYQPEVAARALVHAAVHPGRREYWVGGSTMLTLLGNKIAAGLLDRYLARTAYQSQMTDDVATDTENLWQPADGVDGSDYGAHGSFDRTAHPRSLQLWASHHHTTLAAMVAGATAATAGALVGWRSRRAA
ncbi:MAG TPA: SDR family oxidoreductase [Pseudonocardiaceae bacterium]|nr:SDR family oxidoreductase [Pseudonocardiaceae bacterium]